MAGGPFDPLLLLRARAGDPTAPGAPAAPVPAASPPVVAPSSPAPAPAVGPSAGGGGVGINGIGSAISRAMSGEGLFGSSGPEDEEIDPLTGVPRGLSRRANMQSLMKVGLMLMAAGQPQSAESRARILSGIGGATDDANNQINNFARNRLEMAKTKLLERQQLQEEAANAALMASAGIATGAPAAAPGVIAPPAPVIAPPAVAAGGVPVDPATPAPATPETGAGGPVPASPGTTPNAGGPSTAPNTLQTRAPSLSPLPPWQADQQQADIIRATPLPQRAAKIAEFRRQYETQKRATEPYRVPGVGTVVDLYEGNRKVGTEKLADDPVHVIDVPGPDGTVIRETRDAAGNVTKRDTVRDVRADKAYDMTLTSAQKESEELRTRYKDVANPAVSNEAKLRELQNRVRKGEIIAGKTADVEKFALGWIGTVGALTKKDVDRLVSSRAISAELGAAAGRFAKENYGPQVSEYDVKNAEQLLGAVSTGTPEEIDAALERLRMAERKKVEEYNSYSADYNSRISGLKGFDSKYYGAKPVEAQFADPDPWTPGAGAAAATGAPVPAAAPPADPNDAPPADWSDEQKSLWQFMTPEDKRLFKK